MSGVCCVVFVAVVDQLIEALLSSRFEFMWLCLMLVLWPCCCKADVSWLS